MNIRRELAFWAQITGFPQTVRFLKATMFGRWQRSRLVKLARSDQRYRQATCLGMVWPDVLSTCRTCPLRAAHTVSRRSGLRPECLDE